MNPKCNFQEGPVQVRILPNPVSIFLATGREMINSNVSCFFNQQFARLNLATYVGQYRHIKAHPQVPVISQFLWTNVSVKHSEIMLEHLITVYWFHYDNIHQHPKNH